MFMIFDSLDYIGLEAPSPYFCLGPAEFCVGVLSQGAGWQARRTRCLSTATPANVLIGTQVPAHLRALNLQRTVLRYLPPLISHGPCCPSEVTARSHTFDL